MTDRVSIGLSFCPDGLPEWLVLGLVVGPIFAPFVLSLWAAFHVVVEHLEETFFALSVVARGFNPTPIFLLFFSAPGFPVAPILFIAFFLIGSTGLDPRVVLSLSLLRFLSLLFPLGLLQSPAILVAFLHLLTTAFVVFSYSFSEFLVEKTRLNAD